MISAVLAAALLVQVAPLTAAVSPSPPSDQLNVEQQVGQRLADFVQAFNAVDFVRFQAFFADDATVFMPGPELGMARLDGKVAVMAQFGRMFADLKARGRTLSIAPKDLQVEVLGDTALATFHLNPTATGVSRRTIVLRKVDGQWLIVHLHASRVEMENVPSPAIPPAPAAR